MEPREIRARIRRGEWSESTSGLTLGYALANLVVLPKEWAFDFLLFCQRNPKPCPLLDVTEIGSPRPPRRASDADLRTDIVRYRIYRYGQLEAEVSDIVDYWRKDLAAFLIGCSFTFETALMAAGIPMRHIEEGRTVPMYITNMECVPAGSFRGLMVVSMRPIPQDKVAKAVLITARYSKVHGAPVHIGDPAAIGIRKLARPDFGDPISIREDEVPVFWGCGLTPQVIATEAKPELMITHSPGYMFITDVRNEELADF
jgi:uncharacterized protein YcsI (UPF0317 family)